MKRELEFRVWDEVENKYFEPIYEAYKGNLLDLSISLSGQPIRRTIEFPAEHESLFPDRYIIEQYIGLTDKNGVKIFEGDAVEKNGKPYIIKWNFLHASWGLFTNSGQSAYEIVCDITDALGNSPKEWKDSTLLVVGNIHDNNLTQ